MNKPYFKKSYMGLGAFLLLLGTTPSAWAVTAHVSWDPNNEPDLAGYIICRGTISLDYNEGCVNVGNTANYDLPGLLEGVTYYFSIKAFDQSGNESALSEEVAFVSGDLPIVVGPTANIVVSPGSSTIQSGVAQQFSAVAKDAQGIQLTDVFFVWNSSNPVVASVDALGAATGLTPGSAMITAASDGITSNQVSLLVQGIPDPVTAVIEIQPTSPSIQQNANQSFTAVAKDGQGNIMEDVFFSWSSSNPAVATISGDGVAQGIAPGVAKITASGDGVTSNEASISIAAVPQEADLDFSSMVIKVSPETQTIELGGAQKFTAAATDGAGNVIESLLFTWKSSNPDTASVDKTGLAMGTMKGTSVITASAEGKVSNQALLEVTEFGQGPVASGSVIVQSVQVDPKSISVSVGSSQQYSAVAKDTQGSQVSPEGASWNSSDPKIATVDESGLATGFSKGKAIITASVNSVMSNRSTMTVRAAQQSSSVSGGCGFVRMKGGRPPDIRQIGMNTLVFFAPLVLATLFKGALRIGRMTREQLGDMFSVWNGLRVAAVSLSVFMVAVMSSEMVTMLSQAV